jgi:hypothetical protein
MVEWLAGNRIRGTSTERTNTTGIGYTAGGWVELARTTLGSAADTIDVSSLPDKRYYMLLRNNIPSGAVRTGLRLGSTTIDPGNNYSHRRSNNGGSDVTNVSHNRIVGDTDLVGHDFNVEYIANLSGKEKLVQLNQVVQNTAGAGTAPLRTEQTGKWDNTSNPIDIIQSINTETGSFDTGSEIVVLGWDPADTHTANFWEELASVEYSGGTALTSGTIPAKKYLWVQAYLKIASGTVDSNLWRFNADIQSHYAARYSRDGVIDPTPNASISHMNINFGSGTKNNQLINMFIINNSANEKLVTGSGVSQGASTSGTAPNRLEFAPKWANTTDQITSIQCTQGNSLNFEAGTIMKVWGSD